MDNLILLFDSARGCYIPQQFALHCLDESDGWVGVSQEDLEALREGPDAEWYWQAWDTVEQNAQWVDPKDVENVYRLYQDGDLWAYNIKAAESGELDEFFGRV